MKITFFGTGDAISTNCDNTYFMIEHNGKNLFVDTGGGRELQKRIPKIETREHVPLSEQNEIPMPQNIFLTHSHTDHLLGLPHVLRVIKSPVKIYCTKDMFEKIHTLNEIVGITKKVQKLQENNVLSFEIIEEGKETAINDWILRPINIHSRKMEQFGFSLNIHGKSIVFFGDEAIDVKTRNDIDLYKNPDVLICETFCLESQKEKFKPHEKAHVTAKETGEIANILQPKKVFVTHYAEIVGQERKTQSEEIQREASDFCTCDVIVPLDNESFEF